MNCMPSANDIEDVRDACHQVNAIKDTFEKCNQDSEQVFYSTFTQLSL